LNGTTMLKSNTAITAMAKIPALITWRDAFILRFRPELELPASVPPSQGTSINPKPSNHNKYGSYSCHGINADDHDSDRRRGARRIAIPRSHGRELQRRRPPPPRLHSAEGTFPVGATCGTVRSSVEAVGSVARSRLARSEPTPLDSSSPTAMREPRSEPWLSTRESTVPRGERFRRRRARTGLLPKALRARNHKYAFGRWGGRV